MDCILDILKLTQTQTDVPKLHNKYYRILIHEKEQLRAYEFAYARLYKEKFEFYTQGPSQRVQWKDQVSLPAKGLSSTKREVDMYITADEQIIALNIKIGDQKDKIELLEDIIKEINNRNFEIGNIIKWEKFKAGE